MIVRKAPSWPAFGAVETKLRYSASCSSTGRPAGARLPCIDYNTAWNPTVKNDVVVFFPQWLLRALAVASFLLFSCSLQYRLQLPVGGNDTTAGFYQYEPAAG